MPRARNIKPGFFRNADLVELPYEARLLFIGLWTLADRKGRLEDRPKQIKMELFPADNLDCDALLTQLEQIGVVARYEHGDARYLQVVNFGKHQNPHKDEKVSSIPGPDEDAAEIVGASLEHGASTVPTPCDCSDDTGAILLIPDPRSLIPESINTPLPPKGGERARTSRREFPLCPYTGMVALYHDALPELPAAKLMSEKRKRALRGFWEWVFDSTKSDGSKRAETVEEALAWIKAYFERVRLNDFLMGTGGRSGGHENWRCDLDFLLTEKGKTHVIEKTREPA